MVMRLLSSLLRSCHPPLPLTSSSHHSHTPASLYLLPPLTTSSSSSSNYNRSSSSSSCSSKQLQTSFQHPQDVPVAVLKRLQELGVDDEPTLRLLTADPLHSRPTQWGTVQLFLDEGFTAQQIRTMLKKQLFLLPYQRFVPFLNFLHTLNADGQIAGEILSKHSIFLRSRVETLERRVVLLESLGLENERMKRTLLHFPRIFRLSNATLLKRVGLLRDLGIDNKGILLILRRNPALLCLNHVTSILPKIESLRNRGINTIDIVKLITARPILFSLSLAGLLGKIDVLRQLGYDKDSKQLCKVFSVSGCFPKEHIIARSNMLMAHGLSSDQVRHIVATCPTTLGLSKGTILKKVDYLIKELNRDIKEIACCPAFLTYSLEARITPRFKLLINAKEKGLLEREFSLRTIVTPTNSDFQKWLLKIVTPTDSDFQKSMLKTLNLGR